MRMRLFVIVGALVLSFLAGCVTSTPGVSPLAVPALSGGGVDPVDVPALPDFLEMLAGPTGWLILGAVLSSLLAKWAWYNTQEDALKRGLILGLTTLLAIGARLLITYVPPTFWEKTASYWFIIGGIVIQWLGSQGWFKTVIKPQREKERVWKLVE